jgi:hypothetical protein
MASWARHHRGPAAFTRERAVVARDQVDENGYVYVMARTIASALERVG